jgi:folate-dependent tRNA-U54 methylase TrmFO/GidA
LLEFARRPAPQAEAARANYNSNVICSKSLSSAGEDEAGVGLIVEEQIYRIDVMFWLAFHDPVNK